eukprot:CAMPEP_0116111480 /NCGR_PEP_ID=MMETSP0327-20121206/18468_1 /TAXON_ID=44447 /ORGANISM="Pseudo-nitzschia delicatissima, Strain B596" /LENGTH=752 /DNA_ID=CAMNT_0003604715 /DNA_START=266 /DNA_END=2524 /DNA_ORIENTATION=+
MSHNNNRNNSGKMGKLLLVATSLALLASAASASPISDARNLQDLILQVDPSPPISEAYPCVPASEIQAIHQDSNDDRLPWDNGNSGAIQKECYLQENSCGSQTAASACCRVSYEAGWLVCDAYNAFDFMPCVCNDNTVQVPTAPTLAPTKSPTLTPTTGSPTASPTKSPTGSPTASPTGSPTASPTKSPTGSPTASPTLSPTMVPVVPPTEAPVTVAPTAFPTASPTMPPVIPPTDAPTITSVVPPTEAPIAPTMAPTMVPVVPPTAAPTMTPVVPPTTAPTMTPVIPPTEAPVTAAPTVSPTAFPTLFPTNQLGYTTENKFDADISTTIRQSQCREEPPVIEFVQAATIRYRYEVRLLDESNEEDTLKSALEEGIWKDSIHDEMAREFLICENYESETVWILQSKPHVVDNTACDAPNDEGSNDASACVSVVAEARIIAYQPPLQTTKQAWSETNFREGKTAEKFAQDSLDFLEDRLSSGDGGLGFAPSFGVVFVGGEIVSANNATNQGDENDTTDEDETGNLWADNTSGTAVGVEASTPTSSPQGRLTPAMIATIAAVATCLLLVVVLGAVARNRRNTEVREDEEYLQDVSTPRSDAKHYATHPVDHLDLSDSSDSGGPDIERNAATSAGPSHRGFPVPKSPLHFNFGGFASNAKSPTARERTKMGPLGLADEFRENSSAKDSAKGSHRGIVSNSSSMSSNTNHRGIVSNSSSMSSNNNNNNNNTNNNNLPPPHQNNSPRLYQLRDTVKL